MLMKRIILWQTLDLVECIECFADGEIAFVTYERKK